MIILNKIIDDMEILERCGKDKNKNNLVKVKCVKCNREKIIPYNSLTRNVGSKHSSCGQFLKTKDIRFYNIWSDMRKRTTNKNSTNYKYYGGRGIKSEEFKFFIDFYDYLYKDYLEHCEKYTAKNTTLDRIDVNKNYEKGNLKFATKKIQTRNTRKFLSTPKIKVTNINNNEEEIFDCASDVKKKYNNFNLGHIILILKGKINTKNYHGYNLKYVDKCVTSNSESCVTDGENPKVKDQDLFV